MSRPLIAIVAATDLARDARARREAYSAAEAGFDVVVIGISSERASEDEVWAVPGGRDIRVRRVTAPMRGKGNAIVRRLRNLIDLRRIRRDLARAVIEEQPSLVHAKQLDALPAGVRAKKVLGCPLVYDAPDLYPEFFLGTAAFFAFVQRVYFSIQEYVLIRHADAAFTVSPAIAAEMARRYRVRAPEVVMNTPSREAVEYAGGLSVDIPPMERPTFLYVGLVQPGRGLETAIEAFRRIGAGSLVIVGDGPLRGSLERMIAATGLGERIQLLPALPPGEIIAFARHADVGLANFTGEALNSRMSATNKFFDYQHAGLAVIASDLPFMRQQIEEGGFGVLVPPRDIDALVGAMRTMVDDPEALNRMKRASLEHAKGFVWEEQAAPLIAAYQRLTARRVEPSPGTAHPRSGD